MLSLLKHVPPSLVGVNPSSSSFFLPKVRKNMVFFFLRFNNMLKTRKRGLSSRGYQWINVMVSLFGQVAKNKKCLSHIKSCMFTQYAKQKNQGKHLSIDKTWASHTRKIRMTHGSPPFTIKLKTHKVKTLSQKIYSKNSQINSISKSQKQSTHSTWLLFS